MRALLLIFFMCGSFTCSSQKDTVLKKIKDPLTGLITRETLFKQYPEWQEAMNRYEPDSLITESFGKDLNIDIEIFFGTWCSDSRRDVPRFFKILDKTQFVQPEKVKLWAVDRTKKLNNGLTEKRQIEFVATFIIFMDGKEIGRIVEQPETSLEEDILNICTTDIQ